MKNKVLFNLIILCLFSFFFLSCNTDNAESSSPDSSLPNFDDAELVNLNPERNELAHLMLGIYGKTQALQTQIKKGSAVVDQTYLNDIEKVTQVENGIDGHSFSDFTEYNSILMEQAIALQNSSDNQEEVYTDMINSCIVCHEQYCPKMVQKIEKLLLD